MLSCFCSFGVNLPPSEPLPNTVLLSPGAGGLGDEVMGRQLVFLIAAGEVAAAFTPLRVVVKFPAGLLLAHCADKQNPILLECFGGAGQAVAL